MSLISEADLAMDLRRAPRMTTQILFVQGGGEGAHDQWDKKLVDSLASELGRDYEIRYPLVPNEADPTYADWRTALEKEFDRLDEDAIVIGHSLGGAILIRALAECRLKSALTAVILIAAPFVGEGGWKSENTELRQDIAARLPVGVPVLLFHGTKDEVAPVEHVDLYAETIPRALVRRRNGRDHQLNNDLSVVANDIRCLSAG
jgi:predicted alpha/beta hydrolase family esterase